MLIKMGSTYGMFVVMSFFFFRFLLMWLKLFLYFQKLPYDQSDNIFNQKN